MSCCQGLQSGMRYLSAKGHEHLANRLNNKIGVRTTQATAVSAVICVVCTSDTENRRFGFCSDQKFLSGIGGSGSLYLSGLATRWVVSKTARSRRATLTRCCAPVSTHVERPLWSKVRDCNGSKAPSAIFRERTLKSEAPITSWANRQRPLWPKSSHPRQHRRTSIPGRVLPQRGS